MNIKKPWLCLPSQIAHDLSPYFLNWLTKLTPKVDSTYKEFEWRNLHFKNPLGVAGGVDKNVEQVLAWTHLGAGFLEVGTITPQPQGPNPGKIMDRDLNHLALWNKMGFPNKGLVNAKDKLQNLSGQSLPPIFANIGKNRQTSNEQSVEDYKACVKELEAFVDGFVVNISSPNTKNLRDLLDPKTLEVFLTGILKTRQQNKPTLLKLSPDLDDATLFGVLDASVAANIDGWIFTNTTLSRPAGIDFPAEGGLSGKPLTELSTSTLKKSLKHLGPNRKDRLVVSTGGIMSSNDIQQRLDMSADLVQVYSALVFEGPFFFRNSLQHLKS